MEPKRANLPPMPKFAAKTTVYQLIDAGHLARQSMLVPLQDHGLEPGDDALLFCLSNPNGETEKALRRLTGLGIAALDARLTRLMKMGILERRSMGNKLRPGARLNDRGLQIAEMLGANWQQLDDALLGELDDKNRKKLRKILKRFVTLLSLQDVA